MPVEESTLSSSTPGMAPSDPARSDAAQFAISVERPRDRVEWESTSEQAVFEVRSELGIGAVEVHLTSGDLPGRLLFRLYLRGLEELRFSFGDATVVVSASSEVPDQVRQRLEPAGGEATELSADSPYWMPTSVVTDGSAPARSPLEGGYFELQAPAAFHEQDLTSFQLRWVDFFR
jgi:hypothetical protein